LADTAVLLLAAGHHRACLVSAHLAVSVAVPHSGLRGGRCARIHSRDIHAAVARAGGAAEILTSVPGSSFLCQLEKATKSRTQAELGWGTRSESGSNYELAFERLRECLPGVTLLHLRDLLGRALRDDASTVFTAFRSEIDDPIGAANHIEIVFDDDDGIAEIG